MPGDKYVAVNKRITWTPDGSTTETDIGIFGRNMQWTREANDINASGYGDATMVHLVGKLDVNASLDLMYDDEQEIEQLLVPGSKGLLKDYIIGDDPGNNIRNLTAWIGTANIAEPHEDVAAGTCTFRNADPAGLTYTVAA